MEILSNPNAWVALLTLTFLEIILGIDNIVFLSIVSGKLKAEDQPKARRIGLLLAMAFRIILLFGITWVMSLKDSFFDFAKYLKAVASLYSLCDRSYLARIRWRQSHCC